MLLIFVRQVLKGLLERFSGHYNVTYVPKSGGIFETAFRGREIETLHSKASISHETF